MTPLEELFGLEIEFHRRLRTQAPGTVDATALHTCYALQSGYEPLIRAAGHVAADDIELIRQRLALVADLRDLLAARDSLRQLLGMPRFDGWRIATTARSEALGISAASPTRSGSTSSNASTGRWTIRISEHRPGEPYQVIDFGL